ncbi:MAG TPA: sugar phosphate isomerase/epimerase family protein [Terriglobia bacterium]|nr:sugar phosphate isomerase/epimerase family protein [Terriglobia bacterium]
MGKHERREFLKASAAGALAATLGGDGAHLLSAMAAEPAGRPAGAAAPPERRYKPFALGWIVGLDNDPDAAIAKVKDLGVPTCQLEIGHLDDELVSRLGEALEKYNIVATALGTSGPGPDVYNFYDGPLTLGIVPRTYRAQRIEKIMKFSDYAKQLNIEAMRIHVGFIPEDPNEVLYRETVESLKEIVGHCRRNGQYFLYETGTESPVTLLRTFEDVGFENQGANLDTANLILYGKANPVDALDVIGKYVKNMHAKDGLYPTNPRDLGEEVAIPHGKVEFPKIIARLKELNYKGPVTIEREISGPQQLEEVKSERDYLQKLIEGS